MHAQKYCVVRNSGSQWLGYTVDVTNVFSELLKTIFSLNSFFSKIVDQKQTLAQY